MELILNSSVADLSKVTAPDLLRLSKLGIETLRDLLINLPVGWESYGEPSPIAKLEPGSPALVIGQITSLRAKRSPKRGMNLTEAVLTDEGGGRLKVVWFNQPYLAKQLKVGECLAVAGQVRFNRFENLPELQNPHHERLQSGAPRELGGLMPKYALTAGLTSRRLAGWVDAALPLAEQIEEVIPPELRARHNLPPVAEAIRHGHHPVGEAQWEAARRRMAFAELLEMQIAFLIERRRLQAEEAPVLTYRQEVIDALKAAIGFELTHAQKRSIWEIYQDLDSSEPMNRLLNGDVGSGKTAVAAAAVAMAHGAGVQSVVMAPTEVLARQHLAKFRAYLQPAFPELRIELLVSGLPAARRREIRAASQGEINLLVGTQALLEEEVELPRLGLIVVDEQHRFGTGQRELLRRRSPGRRPHFLAMTATPIPRSLVLALYGEMALSVLDELPPGRTPVRTEVVEPSRRDHAYQVVRQEVRAGRQGFIVCPLIEESEVITARAASQEFERLQKEVFPDLRLALVHGRLKEKEEVMRAFREGESDLLVATAVIEVGVDIPNASVMMIEGADRFGLAQLHQLRGRVGRASHQSHCLLLTDEPNPHTLGRLKLVARIEDGFRLANEDLRLRGAGQLMGARQHWVSDIAMEALLNPQLVSQIRSEAEAILAGDRQLEAHPLLRAAAERRLSELAIS
ncbi:MAG: ATP-dependent DNA helicase RecG [Candidatus Dormibacteraceae bacterium]